MRNFTLNSMTVTEEIIFQQIRQKNLQAFENYYKAYYKEFYLLCYKYVKEPALAQEIVNDIFLKIWEDAENITIEASLKSYMCRAVINRSINALNKHKREMQNQRDLASQVQQYEEQREMETNELKAQLFKAIDKLPDQCKRVFMMSRFDHLKQQEIADKLGISIKTVKNHITYALKRLSKSTGFSVIVLSVLLDSFLKCK